MSPGPDGKRLRWAVLAILVTLIPSPAATAFTLTTTANATAQIFADDLPHLLDLGSVGTTLTVETATSGRLAIFFNAECGVAGLDNITFVDIDILVDGTAIPPSDVNDNAFCTDSGNGSLLPDSPGNWVSASTNGVADVGPGSHDVQVRATLNFFDAGDQFRIDDISLIAVPEPSMWLRNVAALTTLAVLGRITGRRGNAREAG